MIPRWTLAPALATVRHVRLGANDQILDVEFLPETASRERTPASSYSRSAESSSTTSAVMPEAWTLASAPGCGIETVSDRVFQIT